MKANLNEPPRVWGKLVYINNSGARLMLRTHVTQRYGDGAVADFDMTYSGTCGHFVFEPHPHQENER